MHKLIIITCVSISACQGKVYNMEKTGSSLSASVKIFILTFHAHTSKVHDRRSLQIITRLKLSAPPEPEYRGNVKGL